MRNDRRIALAFRAACFLIILIGLLIHLKVFEGSFKATMLLYYTIQSNILALALFGILLAKTASSMRTEGRWGNAGFLPRFEMVCVIDLLLTLLVYWVMLAPTLFSMADEFRMWTFSNMAVHLLAPLFCLVDYFLFNVPGKLKYRDVYAVLIFPFSYVALTSIIGFLGYVFRVDASGREVHFPYFFIDFDQLGAGVFLYILALGAFFIALSHGLYFLDRHRAKRLVGAKAQ